MCLALHFNSQCTTLGCLGFSLQGGADFHCIKLAERCLALLFTSQCFTVTYSRFSLYKAWEVLGILCCSHIVLSGRIVSPCRTPPPKQWSSSKASPLLSPFWITSSHSSIMVSYIWIYLSSLWSGSLKHCWIDASHKCCGTAVARYLHSSICKSKILGKVLLGNISHFHNISIAVKIFHGFTKQYYREASSQLGQCCEVDNL